MAGRAAKGSMRTLAATTTKTTRSSSRGFTLLEVLVVVTIFGILATFAFSRLRIDQPGLVIESEAEQFATRVALARDEAIILGQPLAVIIEAQRYGFARPMRTAGEGLEWLPIEQPRALARYHLPDEQMRLVLSIRGQRQSLSEPGGLRETISGTQTPRIKVTPTGAFTPFALGFRRSGTADVQRWVVVSSQGEVDVTVDR